MAVEIRVFLAIDEFLYTSGAVFAFEVRRFLFIANQTFDFSRRAFAGDLADDPPPALQSLPTVPGNPELSGVFKVLECAKSNESAR